MNKVHYTGEYETTAALPERPAAAFGVREVASRCFENARLAAVVSVLGLLMLAAGPAHGQQISISLQDDMSFGVLAGDATLPGTATINPTTNVKTVSGGVADFGGVHTRASFRVEGRRGRQYSITLPASVTLTSGPNTMTLNNFTSDPSTIGTVQRRRPQQNLYVGATLQVAAGQAAGTYSGMFTVVVNY